MQQRLWVLDQIEPGNLAFSLPILAYKLIGPLSLPALRFAFNELDRRHESLRTIFGVQDGEPRQIIQPPRPHPLPLLDFSALPEAQARRRAKDVAVRDGRIPFDLTRGPLWRARLLKLTPDEHLLVILMHHINSDGWSLGVLYTELTTLYEAAVTGQPSPLPELHFQYRDYAAWQRQALSGDNLEQLLDFWRRELDGAPMLLTLPMDRPRPKNQTFNGLRCMLPVPRSLARDLAVFHQAERATLYMCTLALFNVLIFRLTEQRDMLIGSPMAGRDLPGSDGLIGFFINTIVLRGQVSPEMTFRELLQRTRERVLGVYEYRNLPFDRLVEEVHPQRDISYPPMVQVMFAVQNIDIPPLELSQLHVESTFLQNRATQDDLTFFLNPDDGLVSIEGEYNTDLFDDCTIARMLLQFLSLTRGAIDDPDCRLAELPLLPPEQRQQLLVEWNDTDFDPLPRQSAGQSAGPATDQPIGDPLPGLFRRAAEGRGDAVAVVDIGASGASLSYRELHRRSDRLAHELQDQGAGPETLVAICCRRSLDMVVAVLGVLKAGAAYLPLDPAWPAQRLELLLQESGCRLLLTQQALLDSLPANRPRTLVLDSQLLHDAARPQPAAHADTTREPHLQPDMAVLYGFAPPPRAAAGTAAPPTSAAVPAPISVAFPANLAYLLYTSGSTGTPKGVQISRAAFHSYLVQAAAAWRVEAGDRALQFSALSFDSSADEVCLCLTRGGTLVLRDDRVLDAPHRFLDACARWRTTLLYLATAYWHSLVATGEELTVPACVRLIVLGGEAANPEAVASWRQRVPHTRLINSYGPSETTVAVTEIDVAGPEAGPAHDASHRPVPIGFPHAGVRTYVVDPRRRLLPPITPGELLVGGHQLARGYLHRPRLTAQRFIPDSLSGRNPGGRLYRTGDLVRWLPDGPLEFLGRTDQQIKLRGFRLEPAEIEAALTACPEVAEAAILARQEGGGDARLIAFVVPPPDTALSPARLRDELREVLPAYMVPGIFITLEALPTNTSGKVDRRALAARLEADAAEGHLETGEGGFSAPRTPVEEMVAGVWRDVLKVRRIGVHDSFFELGGHSLLATQVVLRLRTLIGFELPIRHLFETPTIAELSARIDVELRHGRTPPPPMRLQPREGPLPASFAQQRLWFLDRLFPGSAQYNMPVALGWQGSLDVEALSHALDALSRRHESLRTTFGAVDGQPVQIIQPAPGAGSRASALSRHERPLIDLSGLPPATRTATCQHLIGTEASRPFDLAEGPLWRATLLRLDLHDHAFLLTLHHIISDGWSMEILERELATLYAGYRDTRFQAAAGHSDPADDLDRLPVQYADFAAWQRAWLSGDVLQAQLDFWHAQLDGCEPLELPTDRSRRAARRGTGTGTGTGTETPQHRGGHASLHLPAATVEALRRLSQQQGTTLFMLALAGFQTLLHRTTGQRDLVVGSPIANRNQPEIEGLIGFFVNTLALRSHWQGAAPTFNRLLAQVRETCLEAFTHQDLPFEMLVDQLGLQRDLYRSPLVQTMLTLHPAAGGDLELAGLRLRHLPMPEGAVRSRFDLAADLWPHQDGLVGVLTFDLDVFDVTTGWRLAGHLERLLTDAAAHPDRPLAALRLLSDSELHQLRHEHSWTPESQRLAARIADDPVLQVAHQVRARPDAIALVDDADGRNVHLSYADFQRRARRLAGQLQHRRVGLESLRPEDIVAVFAPRSAETLVALQGIQEAGAAYLPLEPSWPRPHLDLLLQETRARAVFTWPSLAERLPDEHPEILDLGDIARPVTTSPPTLPVPDGQGLAYVIYTSGSTGRPKGVQVTRRAQALFGRRSGDLWAPEPGERVLQFTALTFDASVEDIWTAFSRGATLVLRDDAMISSPRRFYDTCARWRIRSGVLATAYWHTLAGSGETPPRCLRLIVIGGEAASPEKLTEWCNLPEHHRCELQNSYGPTEGTVSCATLRLDRGAIQLGRVAIGRPRPGARLTLIDSAGRLVPPGTPGELLIGGDGVARGYLARPALTAERFIPDAFSGNSGTRLYRTGDVVRALPDGRLLYVQRTDHQVKVRGFRVEPGEIETTLESLPQVASAVVVPRREASGDLRLDAFAVPRTDSETPQLLAALRQRLPPYMVPASLTLLDALPMNTSGKVDRRALLALTATTGASTSINADKDVEATAQQAPRDALELQLADLWQDLLGHPVGVHDSFFDSGGHSLLAVRLMSRIERHLGISLPLSSLFEAPTLEDLARLLRRSTATAPARGPVLVPIQRPVSADSPRPPFFAVHPVGGSVLCYADLARALGPEQPFYAFQAPGLDGGPLFPDVESMAEAYVAKLRETQPQGPYHLGGWSFGGLIALEMARQLRAEGEDVPTLVLIDSYLGSTDDSPNAKSTQLSRAESAYGFAEDLAAMAGVELSLSVEDLAAMDEDELLPSLLGLIRGQGIVPPDLGEERLARLMAVHEAHLRAFFACRPTVYGGPALLVRAGGEEEDAESVEVWRRVLPSGECVWVEGDHYSILRKDKVDRLCQHLRASACLSDTAASRESPAPAPTLASPAGRPTPA